VLGRSARTRAARLLDDIVRSFATVGYRETSRPGPLEAYLERPGRLPLTLRFAERGRIFGGQIALEVATGEPVLPLSAGGLVARPLGTLRFQGVSFRALGRDDADATATAEKLSNDPRLADALARVHFERVRVDPDGRPVIRQMGGSIIWMLFPPLVRPVPLIGEQAKATAEALEAFAAAGSHGA
jgi:hypothetical protein